MPEYASGAEESCGQWLQVAIGEGKSEIIYFDDLLTATACPLDFVESSAIKLELKKGKIR